MANNNKQKLELTWIGKNNPEYDIANIEPRILEETTLTPLFTVRFKVI